MSQRGQWAPVTYHPHTANAVVERHGIARSDLRGVRQLSTRDGVEVLLWNGRRLELTGVEMFLWKQIMPPIRITAFGRAVEC